MRYFFLVTTMFLSFVLFAQEPALVPIASADEKEEEEEKKEEKKSDYQDLYQQFLNKYNQEQKPAQTPEPVAPAEPVQPAQPAEPVVEQEAPAVETAEPAAEAAVEAAPEAAAPAVTETAPAPIKEAKPPKEVVPLKPFDKTPYFSLSTYGEMSNSIHIFGKDVLSSSYNFALENAILDIKGGNKIFNARLLVDFARGFTTSKEVVINYNHNPSEKVSASNPLEFDVTPNHFNALDILRDVSLKMTHPTYRKNNFGLNLTFQAGKFNMPFGIETLHEHEEIFGRSHVDNVLLGNGFNDLGLSLGIDFLFSNEMDLGLKFFLFNGSNETMLDGQNKFQDPALGFDLRFNYKSDFYATVALSFIWGSVYHDYDETIKDGIFLTTNGTYLNDESKVEADKMEKTDASNDYAGNRKNMLLAIGTDLGYSLNENIDFGLMAQFVLSNRGLFNPTRVDSAGNTHFEKGDIEANNEERGKHLRFLRDGSGNYWGSSYYTTWGIFAAPYTKLYMFDIMARVGYNKAPYLYRFIEDSRNSTLSFDLEIAYNFCDYGALTLAYTFVREEIQKYDRDYNIAREADERSYIKDIFNHNIISLNISGNYDFLWEKK
ncbi:MAG: hypothetical protein ACOX2F_04320 [bacterium]